MKSNFEIKFQYIFGLFFLIFLVYGSNCFSQSLKNISLGEKYSGTETIETTVGGFNGTLKISKLNDGTVVNILFISKRFLSNELEAKIFAKEADAFMGNVQNNYKLSFNLGMWKHAENSGQVIDIAFCKKDNAFYMIHFSTDLKVGQSELQFGFYDEELREKYLIENDIKKIKDF